MSRHSLLIAGCLLLAGAVCSAPANGEVFVLKSGGRIEAEYLNPRREAGQPYQLRTEDGLKLALAETAVQRVIVKTDLDKQYEALLPKVANTVESHWNMAEWCKEAGLVDQRKRHLMAVINLHPDHDEARKALGYRRYGSRWLTPDEYMVKQGYVRSKGSWKLRQEIELEGGDRQHELAEKQYRKDVRRWFDQVAGGGRNAAAADRELNAINDADAAPTLAEVLADSSQSRAVRLRALAILAKLPPGLATRTLINIAMNDGDNQLADACLDELKRQGSHLAAPTFLSELSNKRNLPAEKNYRINQAAYCLQRLDYKDATLPLINALITEHQVVVPPAGPPGGMSATFGSGAGGSSPGGGMSMGGKPTIQKQSRKNDGVRTALTVLHPGVNFNFDVDAWRDWYVHNQSTSNIDLRREQ